jgi:hypothetical protein
MGKNLHMKNYDMTDINSKQTGSQRIMIHIVAIGQPQNFKVSYPNQLGSTCESNSYLV